MLPETGKQTSPMLNNSQTTLIGAAMLLTGLASFGVTLAGATIDNWWALFIFMPAVLLIGVAQTVRRVENGRFPFFSRTIMALSLIIFTVATLFILEADWSVWWPMMVLTPGLGLLFIGLSPKDLHNSPALFALTSMLRWIGGAVALLAMPFFFNQFGLIELGTTFVGLQWWGFFMLIPALGILGSARRASTLFGAGSSATQILTVSGTILLITAVVELFNLGWGNAEIIFGSVFLFAGFLWLALAARSPRKERHSTSTS